ncbi:MAG: AAA family ATPase [Bacteriovoracaceae bacterium]
MSYKRLYVFTGKGGVGKTTCALSLANHLVLQGKKVLFVEFESQVSPEIFEQLKIKHYVLSLLESANGYIAKKLKSKMIASWVVRTPFFKSLINMIPGFSYIIFLGHLLELVYNDPELILIIDSPSSGHASTLFEACKIFKKCSVKDFYL